MEHMNINQFNEWAKEHILDDNKFDDNGYIIMENDDNFKSTGTISQIFEDHWNSYYSKYKVIIDSKRPNANKEVNKIIDCANHNLGASVYVCPHDDEVIFSHHTCKSRLCSSCGIKSQKIKTQNILEKCINTKHRHITFTTPNDLNMWFFDDLYTNDILFKSVCDTIYSVVNGKVKKKYKYKYMPGFFAFLHTFGRPLNFNPHIHVIIAEGLIDKKHNFKMYNYFNYDALSKRFMKILLDNMEKHFGKDKFKETKNKMYLKYKNGFYVNNKLEDDGYKFNSIEDLIRYVTRYCSRPVIAKSRILDYDGKNVTWFYTDHTHEEYHEITESAFSFITKILRHLLPNNFKSIRYYGFYNKSSSLCDKLITIIKKEKIPFMRSLLKWHNSILTSFNRIPIKCPKCGSLMELSFEVT
jgi:hypothetical protein